MTSKQLAKKKDLLEYFEQFSNPDPTCDGLERFLSVNGKQAVFDRFAERESLKLNKVQLNQLFILSGLTSISFGFFKYYWLCLPNEIHPYNIIKIEGHDEDFDPTLFVETDEKGNIILEKKEEYHHSASPDIIFKDKKGKIFIEKGGDRITPPSKLDLSQYREIPNTVIKSWKHFRWGLRRLYVDALFYFGNITFGFTELGTKKEKEIRAFFKSQCFDTGLIKNRGHALEFEDIPQNDRYLISEMACQNLSADEGGSRLRKKLLDRFFEAKDLGIDEILAGRLLAKEKLLKRDALKEVKQAIEKKKLEIEMAIGISTSDILEEKITSIEDIDRILAALTKRFISARKSALKNTKLYLSLVNDMDVYVATSMRNKLDFLLMASNCKDIFEYVLKFHSLNLRYFDPTMSAAEGHEDKGIIECLMVKCAKVLIYTSGDKDSYGKDAEAAMALSSGKPVIFLCDQELRRSIFRDVHPLSKLVDFKTGVANGAMIAENNKQVGDLLSRLFNNEMEYELQRETEKSEEGHDKVYFRLIDRLTESTVRIQTSDLFLSKSFWNYFDHHIKPKATV